jgi:hypothetical protein
LYLDLLGNFAASIDPVALESAEDAIKGALFDLEPYDIHAGINFYIGLRIFMENNRIFKYRKCFISVNHYLSYGGYENGKYAST